jgi:hypothetical protein
VASSRTPSSDTLFGKDNEVSMKIEFYSLFGANSGSANFLGEVTQLLHDGSSPEDIWLEHSLEAIAPASAVEARLTFVFEQPSNQNGAIWIDTAGLFLEPTQAGDFDADGDVDGADFLAWQRDPSVGDLADWSANFGTASALAAAQASTTAVPEPASFTLALMALVAFRRYR